MDYLRRVRKWGMVGKMEKTYLVTIKIPYHYIVSGTNMTKEEAFEAGMQDFEENLNKLKRNAIYITDISPKTVKQ